MADEGVSPGESGRMPWVVWAFFAALLVVFVAWVFRLGL
jgi:hypothetical protein